MSRTLSGISLFEGFALFLAIAQTGCLSPVEESSLNGQTTRAKQPILSTNRLSMNRLSMNRLSLNGLSTQQLSVDGLSLSSTPLIETPEGRELLTYVVRCALPEDEMLTGTHGEMTYTFNGNVGLAPEWLSKPLSPKERRWITACLLAHVNGYGIEVPISLRGEHPALITTASERQQYQVQEAAFYGDVFAPQSSSADKNLFVCAGSTVEAQCGGSIDSYVPRRTCGTNSDCDLDFIGPCRNDIVPQKQACENSSEFFVEDCFTEVMGQDGWSPDSVKYREVITVYLKPSTFNDLYTGCAQLP